MRNRSARRLAVAGVGVLATIAAALAQAPGASAYGAADQPVAQVEISGNCDNPNFWFCANVVGTGGIWAWAELDNVASATVSGWNEMDATVAECGHTVGGGGPGSAGGFGHPDPFGVWHQYASLGAALGANPNAAPIFAIFGTTYTGSVYVLDFFPGSGQDDFEVAVPTQQGHYSAHPAKGVSIQIQIAP
jgi:hypothetical protein